MLCCAHPFLDMSWPPGVWKAVDREGWAPQRPTGWRVLLGPAALRISQVVDGRRHQREGGNLGGVCWAFVETGGKVHPVPLPRAAFLREQGLPVWPRRASLT